MDCGGSFAFVFSENQKNWDYVGIGTDSLFGLWEWCSKTSDCTRETMLAVSGSGDVDCHSTRLFLSVRSYIFILCIGLDSVVLEPKIWYDGIGGGMYHSGFKNVFFRPLSNRYLRWYFAWDIVGRNEHPDCGKNLCKTKEIIEERRDCMAGIVWIAVGLIFTGLDFFVDSGWMYPESQVTRMLGKYELAPSIRTFTLDNTLGDQVRIDILPDIVGCILIFIGACQLYRYNKQYLYGMITSILVIIATLLFRGCGFVEQGSPLVIWIIFGYFGQAALVFLMEYYVLYCTVGITDTLVNRGTNTRILFGWWLTVLCRGAMTFLDFVGHTKVSNIYRYFLVAFTLFTVIQLVRTKKYVGSSEPVKLGARRKREHVEKL